ncbi:hypothetical protein CJU90_4287 [Yarrowia sp. C11]|nr:hypothetical protein CJU90_4287 [Yarrowia sp. C11]
MDTLPVEIFGRIFGYCSLESAVALSQTCQTARATWSGLDTSLVRQKVLQRAPWFTLNESGTGLTSWTKCALAAVARSRLTKHSLRGWSAVKRGTAKEQIKVKENCRFVNPVAESSLSKGDVVLSPQIFPQASSRATKVRHSDPSISVCLLGENDVFLHFANEQDQSDHNIANKSLCSQDEDGTWVVSNTDFLWDFTQVTLLPNDGGAFVMSYFFHGAEDMFQNTPLRVQMYHVTPDEVPVTCMVSVAWQETATKVGPEIYLELSDSYYFRATVQFSLIYNGFFYTMLQTGFWIRFWVDLEAVDKEGDLLLAYNSNFPVLYCELVSPGMTTHVRGNSSLGLDRYFVLPYRKLSWIGDLLTGASYLGETLHNSQQELGYQIAPFFRKGDTDTPGFYSWPERIAEEDLFPGGFN